MGRIYLQPKRDVPVYVVQKESGEGRRKILHTNLLLPIGTRIPIPAPRKKQPVPVPRKIRTPDTTTRQKPDLPGPSEHEYQSSDEDDNIPIPVPRYDILEDTEEPTNPDALLQADDEESVGEATLHFYFSQSEPGYQYQHLGRNNQYQFLERYYRQTMRNQKQH